MAKGKDKTEEEAARPADSGRVSGAPVSDEVSAMFAGPAAAFAAMTAIGFGVATQMANVFLNSLQAASRPADDNMPAAPETPQSEKAAAEPVRPPVVTEPKSVVVPLTADEPVKSVKTRVEAPAPVKAKVAKTKSAAEKAKPEAGAAPEKEAVAEAKPKARPGRVAAAPKPAAPKAVASRAVAVEPAPAKAAVGRRAKADDLKKISGVGPKLEQLLNDLGVRRYADIAGWSEADIARFDAELGVGGRIERDNWIAQAKGLMGGKG